VARLYFEEEDEEEEQVEVRKEEAAKAADIPLGIAGPRPYSPAEPHSD
jgi:hypothetical protein